MENIMFIYISVHTEAQTLLYDKLGHIPREPIAAE
jgi:hypothetical protein